MRTTLSRKVPVRDGMVTVRDLADALEMDRSGLHKILRKRGVAMEKRRCHEARGAVVSVLSQGDTERFLGQLRAETLGGGGEVAYLGDDAAKQ